MLELFGKLMTPARIGAFELDVDDRFRLALADRGQPARRVAGRLDDGVDQAMDGQPPGRDRAGDAVDEERHIVVDEHQAHAAMPRLAAGRLDPQGQCAGFADRRGVGDERGRAALLIRAEPFNFPRQRIAQECLAERADDRLDAAGMGRHVRCAPPCLDGRGL